MAEMGTLFVGVAVRLQKGRLRPENSEENARTRIILGFDRATPLSNLTDDENLDSLILLNNPVSVNTLQRTPPLEKRASLP
jgi:hypothetical protein